MTLRYSHDIGTTDFVLSGNLRNLWDALDDIRDNLVPGEESKMSIRFLANDRAEPQIYTNLPTRLYNSLETIFRRNEESVEEEKMRQEFEDAEERRFF